MLIKGIDEHAAELATIERLLLSEPPWPLEQALRDERSSLLHTIKHKRAAACHLDFSLDDSPSWAVIHDLRLEMGEQVEQFDHLLINLRLEFYLLDSRQYLNGRRQGGQLLSGRPEQRLQRQSRFLRHYMNSNCLLPERLGLTLRPRFRPVVLLSSTLGNSSQGGSPQHRPEYLSHDMLLKRLVRPPSTPVLGEFTGVLRRISSATLKEFAGRLAQRHMPLCTDYTAHFGLEQPRSNGAAARGPQDGLCDGCSEPVPLRTMHYCQDNREMFAGKVYCQVCQRVAAFHPGAG